MARYYKHTHTVTKNIPYQFRCEQCQQDSGPLKAEFKAEATRNKMTKAPLKEQEKEDMHQEAVASLNKAIEKARQDTAKETFASEFKDKCPHCGKPQSWSIKGMGSLPLAYGFIGAIIAAVISLAGEFTASGVFATVTAFALGGALIGFLRIGIKKLQTKNIAEKQKPRISWPEVDAERLREVEVS